MVDVRQTQGYADYLSKIGWLIERVGGANYFIKKFPIIGSVLKIQRPGDFRYNDIKILSAKYRAFQIIVEPKDKNQELRIRNYGFRLSNSPYLPTKTLQLDLTKSEKQLIKEMKKDARLAVRKNYQLSVFNFQTEKQIGDFRNAWKKAVGWKRYVPPLSHLAALQKSFRENCLFLVAKDKSSGAIFLLTNGIAYYWQAFTNSEGRKKLVQYKIVWEGIRWAKKNGAKVFDFEGIYDEKFPNKRWLGFTHFKKSFGGYEVSYPGCFTKWFIIS